MENKNIYFNIKSVLPYEKTFNIIIGGRGVGKTYSAKHFLINEFLKNGKTFVWIRNTIEEVKLITNNVFFNFLSDLNLNLKEIKIKKEKNKMYINDKYGGQFLSLSEFAKIKGNSFNDYYLIIDEFIEEKNARNLFDREYAFKSILESVFRLRKDYKVFLLANSINKNDRILNIFDIEIEDFGIYQNKQKDTILFYLENSENFKLKKALTPLAKLEEKGESKAVSNNYFLNSTNLIKKDVKGLSKLFCIYHKGYNLLFSANEDFFYVKFSLQEIQNETYSTSMSDNFYILPNKLKEKIKEIFKNKLMFFESTKVLSYFLDLIN